MKNNPVFTVALDSFKGSISSCAACDAVKRGILSRIPSATVYTLPTGDGGEGTAAAIAAAIVAATDASVMHNAVVHDTHMFETEAELYIFESSDNMKTAVFDMASPCGIVKAKSHGLDILSSTTYGVGEMILYAKRLGCRRIIVCLGGSGTSDGGCGALNALGVKFYDKNGEIIRDVRTSSLGIIAQCDLSVAINELADTELTLLYDSAVRLTGGRGAVMMYSRQKGADDSIIQALEPAMCSYAAICTSAADKANNNDYDYQSANGAGAAGGLGFGLSVVGGKLTPGADYVLSLTGFDALAEKSDVVITGEGKTDIQTATGKLPFIVSRRAKKYGKPVVCLCGCADEVPEIYNEGIDAVFSITDSPMTLEESMSKTSDLLAKTSFNLAGLIEKLL